MTGEAGPGAPRLSVVLAVRDGEALLPTQLEALARQDVRSVWELVAVDDGSTDGTRAVLERSGAAGLPVRIVPGAGRGMAGARSVGVAAAAGDHLVFLDHDDEVAPGYLAAMDAALDHHELVAARLDVRTLNRGWVGEYRPPMQVEELADDFRPFASGCSLAIRRATLETLGGFDDELHGPEDRDLCYRAAFAGVELVLVPDAVLRYRYRRDLRAIFRQAARGGRGTVALYRRHRSRGMPARLLKAEVRRWLDLLVDGARRRARVDRARQAHELGALVGHVQGCARERVWWFRWR